MKIKTMLKFLLCFLIISLFIVRVPNAFAAGGPSASQFFSEGEDAYNDMTDYIDNELSPVKHIQSLIMYLGILIAIVVVLVFGIQWVTATSAKRQELKAGMWPLAIGIILLVIGPKLVISIFESISSDKTTMVEHTNKVAGSIISVVQTIGYIVAIVMILWVGIQWLTSNPNKRQELKSRMLNIVIGAILIAGGVTILDWVANIATNDMQQGGSYTPSLGGGSAGSSMVQPGGPNINNNFMTTLK